MDWIFPGSTLAKPIDGDSFVADTHRQLDYGFHVLVDMTSRQKFRLNRCNAAPISTPSGKGAAERTSTLLSAGPFTITSVGPYAYGDEWMAEVTLADGRNLTDLIIAEQWAVPWNGRGPAPLPPWPRTVS